MEHPGDHGVRLTYAESQALVDNPPEGWERTYNRRSVAQRHQAFHEQYEQLLWDTRANRVRGIHENAVGRVEQADKSLDAVRQQIKDARRGLDTGRMEPEEVLEVARSIPPVLATVTQALDASRDDEEAAEKFMALSPEEFQAAEIERFPLLAKGLPRVSEAWLKGEHGAVDPFAKPRSADDRDKASGIASFIDHNREGGDES